MTGTAPWSYPDAAPEKGATIPERVDVVVVGGGITGLAAARALAMHGAGVVVYERHRVGHVAARHSLGILQAGFPGGPHDVMRRVGAGKTTALWIALGEAFETIADMLDTTPATLSTRTDEPRRQRQFEADAAWLAERGFDARFSTETGSLLTNGAVIDPLDLAIGLAEGIEKEGGIVRQNTEVTSVSRHTNGFQVLTDSGKTSADAVIVAAGPAPGHSGVPAESRVVTTVDRYGAAIRLEGLEALMDDGQIVVGDGLTIRGLGDDHALVATHRGLRSGREPDVVASEIAARACDLLKTSAAARVVHAWSAPIGVTADGVPHVWRDDAMWFGGGYNGDGLVPALALGSQLGDVVAGKRAQTIFGGITPPRRRRMPRGRMGALLDRRFGW